MIELTGNPERTGTMKVWYCIVLDKSWINPDGHVVKVVGPFQTIMLAQHWAEKAPADCPNGVIETILRP